MAISVCGTDVVQIGGVSFPNQVVELATYVNGDFDFTGLLGLGFSALNTVEPTPAKTFFDNVIPTLKLPLFAVNFNPTTPNNLSYDFGYIDQNKYSGTLSYIDIFPPYDDNNDSPNPGYWMFKSSNYKFGDGAPISFDGGAINVIADTGTTLMYLTDEMVNAYYQTIPGAAYDVPNGLWVYPCSQTNNVQTISLNAGDTADAWITITKSALDNGPVNSTHCLLGLQSSQGFGINIIGDT